MIGKRLFRGCVACVGVMIAVIIWLVPASADAPAERPVDRRIPPLATVEPAGPIVPIPTSEQAFSPVFLEHDPPSILSLTEEGCCAGSAWSIDSEWILYFDKPSPDDPVGLYGIPFLGGDVTLFNPRVGSYAQDWSLVAYNEAGVTYVERWADGSRWPIPSEGREVHISPNGEHVLWEIGSRAITSPDRRQRKTWISNYDGGEPRELLTLHGGSFIGWIGDDSILVSGRLAPPDPAGLWKISISDGGAQRLFDTVKPRSVLLSPNGKWLAVTIAFENVPGRNGIWAVRTDGRLSVKLPVYGSYRWRTDGHLLVIPLDMDEPDPYVLQFDLEEDRVWRITDPLKTSLPIANNDWQVSPDGQKMVFLSAIDGNLQVLYLPSP